MRTAMIFLLLLMASPAVAAGSSKAYAKGGPFAPFEQIVAQYNASGEPFRIEGHCQSSCTMFLGIRNVCVERSARLLFHAGKARGVMTPGATARMTTMYNSRLRAYLDAGGYMDTLALHTLSGAEIVSKFGYKACPQMPCTADDR